MLPRLSEDKLKSDDSKGERAELSVTSGHVVAELRVRRQHNTNHTTINLKFGKFASTFG